MREPNTKPISATDTPAEQEITGFPDENKVSLAYKLRHPLQYKLQFKVVSSHDHRDSDAEAEVLSPSASGDNPKSTKLAKNKKEKKKQPKRDKKPKAKKEKKPKTKQPKKKEQTDNTEKRKHRVPIPLAMLLALVLSGGGAAGYFLFLHTEPTPEERLERAVRYVEQQKYDRAITVYSELIDEDEAVVDAYLGLAEVYVDTEDLDSALDKLKAGYNNTGDDRLSQRLEELSPEPVTPPADREITFRDPAFDRMVRIALNKNAGETITQGELDAVKSLKILGNSHAAVNETLAIVIEPDGYTIGRETFKERGNISSLDDLTHFHNLTRLTIGYNSVGDISGLQESSSLKMLGLYANEINTLDALEGMNQLEYLYLYHNNIQDIGAVSTLTGLRQLLLQHNQIEDLSPVANLTNLEELFVSYNNITDLSPVANLTNLRQLFVAGNQITDLSPVGRLTKLEFLYAQDNQITDLRVLTQMNALTDVAFSGNPVTDYSPTARIANVNRPLGNKTPVL